MEFRNATPIKKMIPDIAKKHNLDPKLLADIYEDYTSLLNQAVSNLDKPIIIINGLGRLRISKNKVEFTINKILDFLKLPESNSIDYVIKKKYFNHTRLLKLKKTLEILKTHQELYGKQNKNNLEK